MKIGAITPLGAFQADCFVKCYETTLTSAQTSITISGLDGDTDVEYRLIVRLVSGAAGGYFLVRLNNDSTADVYGEQRVLGQSSSVLATRATRNGMPSHYSAVDSGEVSDIHFKIYAKSGHIRAAISEVGSKVGTTTVNESLLVGHSWNNTADNITSIVLAGMVTDTFGIGSYIVLYKKVARA